MGDIRGRMGRSAYPDLEGGIWIHAVSVGEIGVARNLLRALRKARPGCRIGLSVTTAAGRELAERTLSGEASIFAYPFDLAGPVERALDATRPSLVLLTETEIWPLFLERAAGRGVPVALVNGRISERSFRGYRRVRPFLREALGRISLFAMQSAEDARRVTELGALESRVLVGGNVKYDLPSPAPFADATRLGAAAAGRPIVVAGSTGEGEEALVLDAWQRLAPRPLLVLAPRRPERFDEVARLCQSRGFKIERRSTPARLPPPASSTDIYLLDSIGELASIYGHAALAFIGGSLVARGGQNPIEAWAAGVTAVAGPHMENFRDVAAAGRGARDPRARRRRRGSLAGARGRPRRARGNAAPRRRRGPLRPGKPGRRRPHGRGRPRVARRRRGRRERARDPVAALRALREGAEHARAVVRLRPAGVARAAAAVDLGRQPDLRRHRQDAVRRVPRAAPALRGLAPGHPLARLRPPVARRGGRGRRGRRPRFARRGRRRAGRARPRDVRRPRRRRRAARGRGAARGGSRRGPLPARRRLPAPRRAPRREPAAPGRARSLRRRPPAAGGATARADRGRAARRCLHLHPRGPGGARRRGGPGASAHPPRGAGLSCAHPALGSSRRKRRADRRRGIRRSALHRGLRRGQPGGVRGDPVRARAADPRSASSSAITSATASASSRASGAPPSARARACSSRRRRTPSSSRERPRSRS